MAILKTQALCSFFSGLNLPAYEDNTVPTGKNAPELPYITYATATSGFDSDAAKPTPFVSESFGGYSYSKGQNAAGAANNSWQAVFADELRKWRRISL